MPQSPPTIVILAGPNGAGKSTAAPVLLSGHAAIGNFVNADVIARELAGFDPNSAAVEAAAIMIERIADLAEQRIDFALETTLASRSLAPFLKRCIHNGYSSHLVYLWLASADLAVARVRNRVREGGHDVPEETIRRRYLRGVRNHFELYLPIVQSWRVYDASSDARSQLVAESVSRRVHIIDQGRWQQVQEVAK